MKEQLQTLFDQLKNALEGAEMWAQDLDKRDRLIEQKELSLVTRHKEVDIKERAIVTKQEEYARNKEYIDRENVKLSKAQHQLEYDQKELKDIKKQEEVVNARQQELTKHELALGEKIKEYEGLAAKENELQEREALVAREVAIDRERKRVLDLRVARIKQREEQLNLDDELGDI